MSEPKTPPPAKLVVSIIFRDESGAPEAGAPASAVSELEEKFGRLDYKSPVFSFDHTDYYTREMGHGLKRQFVSFQKLVDREQLLDIKLHTNDLEKKFLDHEGRRRVNIDPGLLSMENFILATGKNFTHRIYLGRGVFAELTLLFQEKKFKSMPWTFPDYASKEVQEILMQIRAALSEDLKKRRGVERGRENESGEK